MSNNIDNDNDDTVLEDTFQQPPLLYYFTVGVAYYDRNDIVPGCVKHIASEKATLTMKEALEIIKEDDRSYDIVTSMAPISKAQYDCLLQEEEEKRVKRARRREKEIEERKNGSFMTYMSADAMGIMFGFMLILFMVVFYSVGQFITYVHHAWTQK